MAFYLSTIQFHKTQAYSVNIMNTLSSRTTSRTHTALCLVTAGIKKQMKAFNHLCPIVPSVSPTCLKIL